MRIAITGGTGFLGRYLLRELAGEHTLRAWHRATSDRSGLEDIGDRVEWVHGELGNDRDTAALVDGCDAVVHAALHRPGAGFRGAEGNIVTFAERNILGTLKLIEAARTAGAQRFVFISTCAVHEKILDDRPLDEAHPLWPTSHYGAHKAAIEKFIHSYGLGAGYAVCSLRPTGIYGLAHPANQSRFFDLVAAIKHGDDITVEGGGKEVHAADVARAVTLLLQADGIGGEAYNCYDRYISQHEVATIAKRLSGSSSRINGAPKTPKHQIQTGKLEALGMRFGGDDLLERTVGEILEHA